MISYDSKEKVSIKKIVILFFFSKITRAEIKAYTLKESDNKEGQKELWAIFGKKNKKTAWQCIQVGSSKNINAEIKGILYSMISTPREIKQDTTFHKNVYTFYSYMDKLSVKYREIYRQYNNFFVCKVDVKKVLNNINIEQYDPVNYAEVKFAYDNKALLWNPAPATNGNKEREIFTKFFQNT